MDAVDVRRAADLLAAHPFRCWFFGDSIGFEGLIAASRRLGDPRWEEFARGYFRAWAARRDGWRELDCTAPGHALCQLYEREQDQGVLDGLVRLSEFVRSRRLVGGAFVTFERAPLREPYGGGPLSRRDRDLLREPGAGVFVDCLHFDPPFLAHLGRLLDDREMTAVAEQQALAYLDLLRDEESGLFFHFYLERTGLPYILGWSRGQGWVLLGLLDLLEQLPEAPARQRLEVAFVRLLEALAATQLPSGHWPVIVGDAGSGSETSTAAFFAAAAYRGFAAGLLDPAVHGEAAERAWAATKAACDASGMLAGVSVAVGAATVAHHYAHVPIGDVVPWGQGPLILAADARHAYTGVAA